ncbi:MAG TPA: hypothetical protein VJ910_04005 [Desulfuromonadales bacterium]|nr:hypothetical protein [Desulfuromonadales bacterium]
MQDKKIKVEIESGQTIEVVVTEMKPQAIWILLGEGMNSVRCKLEPTRNELAYAGSVMGRELIYHRSVKEVQAEVQREQAPDERFKHLRR